MFLQKWKTAKGGIDGTSSEGVPPPFNWDNNSTGSTETIQTLPDPVELPVAEPSKWYAPSSLTAMESENLWQMDDLRTNENFLVALRGLYQDETVSMERVAQDLPPIDMSNNILEQALQSQANIEEMDIRSGCLTSPRILRSKNNSRRSESCLFGKSTKTGELALIAETEKYLMVGRKPQRTVSASGCIYHVNNSLTRFLQVSDETSHLIRFFDNSTCYDVMPTHVTVAVIGSRLPIFKALNAMVIHGLCAVPLWNTKHHQYSDMLTATDFLHIFLCYHELNSGSFSSSSAQIQSPHVHGDQLLAKESIDYWLDKVDRSEDRATNECLCWALNPTHSLLSAIRIFQDNRVHYLPVVNSENGDLLYCLTQERILAYLYMRLPLLLRVTTARSTASVWKFTLESCATFLGTWSPNVVAVTPQTSLVDAVRMMLKYHISALPVLDRETSGGKLVDLFTKYDFMRVCCKLGFWRGNLLLNEAIQIRNRYFPMATNKPKQSPGTCVKTTRIVDLVVRMVSHQVDRLMVLDSEENRHVIGVVTAGDVLRILTTEFHTENHLTE